ncbi:MAG: PAS domain S-box protein, partial [Syntrophobacteraceae bacterium]|nr:PAS domain S-box protein [Syntrophobacteraceae bacterium]
MSQSKIDSEVLQGFQKDREPLLRERVNTLLALGWLLVPLFGVVDYGLYPQHFSRFMIYRALVAAGCFTLNIVNWKWNLGRRSLHLGVGGAYLVAVSLMAMIHETGAYATPYYAGLNLVFLAFCTMLPVRTHTLAFHTLVMYLIYLISILAFQQHGDLSILFANNMFIIATIIIALVVSDVGYRLRLKEYFSRLELQNVQEELKKYSKNLEHSVTESEEKYQILVESAHDCIFVLQDGHVRFPNSRTVALLGFSAEDLRQVPFVDVVHPEDRDSVDADCCGTPFENGSVLVNQFRVVNRSGEVIWVEMNLVRIDWKGRPAHLVFLRDITERKRMEAELIQAQKMEAIGTLAGGIAHDFNNILTAILGYTELARQDIPEEHPARQSLAHVLKASERAKKLVAQILTFSRQGQQERKAFHLTPMLEETLGFIKAILPATIELNCTIPSDPIMVYGDPTQINQVVMNLLTNSIHAMRKEGGVLEVELSAERFPSSPAPGDSDTGTGTHVVLSIKDTGHGMDADTMTRIFDPFYTTKSQGEGTGMGLSVALGIVKNHGGTISVTSEPGKGSTFEVLLPRLERKIAEKRVED